MFRKAEIIIHVIALNHELTIKELREGPRTKHIAAARQEAIKELRATTDLSWREIGMLLNYPGRAWPSRAK